MTKATPMLTLTNAFSINMLDGSSCKLAFQRLDRDTAREMVRAGFVSAVGHASTAQLFEAELRVPVTVNRATIEPPLDLLVGQYTGPRLPEGVTKLPDSATITWWRVLPASRTPR